MRSNPAPPPTTPCTKCGGSLYSSQDNYGPYVSCRQCGNMTDLLLVGQLQASQPVRPAAASARN